MFKLFWVGDDDHQKQKKIQDEDTSEIYDEDEWEEEEDTDHDIGHIALDVLENHESVYILAPVAGIDLQDIDISIHETTLSLSWVRNKPKEFFAHGMQVKNQECFWGKFLRKIILPDNMDFSQVQAVMEHNLLVIHIPKIRFDSKTIKIHRLES